MHFLRVWRRRWGVTQWDLSVLLGYSNTSLISRWENGHVRMVGPTVRRVLKVLTAWENKQPQKPQPWERAVELVKKESTVTYKPFTGVVDHVELRYKGGNAFRTRIPSEHSVADYRHLKAIVGFAGDDGQTYWFYSPSRNLYKGEGPEGEWFTGETPIKPAQPKVAVGDRISIVAQVKSKKPGRHGYQLNFVRRMPVSVPAPATLSAPPPGIFLKTVEPGRLETVESRLDKMEAVLDKLAAKLLT